MATFRNKSSLFGDKWLLNEALENTQPVFTCSKSKTETIKNCVKYIS